MKELRLETGSGASTIVIGESLSRLSSQVGGARCVIVTDRTVLGLYGRLFPPFPVFAIGLGEEVKTLETVSLLYDWFLSQELDRTCLVVGVGGGVVSDVAGFAAATYLRGMSLGFVPTTLLAQVDATTGGKNGVNFRGYKNLVGTYRQPRFVLCDPTVLTTLPREELANGFAEVVKQAIIGDEALFSYLEASWRSALALEPGVIERIVHDSLRVKTGIVGRDEREKGERRKLNFGHTVGHALEKVAGLRHGEAVAVGMAASARLSARLGVMGMDDVERIERLLAHFDLPVRTETDPGLLAEAMRKDKKREGEELHVVLPEGIGSARIVPLKIDEVNGMLEDVCSKRES